MKLCNAYTMNDTRIQVCAVCDDKHNYCITISHIIVPLVVCILVHSAYVATVEWSDDMTHSNRTVIRLNTTIVP